MPTLKPHDPLAAVRKDPTKVKSLVFNPAHLRNKGFDSPPLRAFPIEILACKNLSSLEIFRGLAGRDQSLPKDFGRLAALEKLSLGGIKLKTLPDSIGKLTKLKTLELNFLNSLEKLPDAIGDCKSLESLTIYDAPKLKTLPKTIGRLTKLKKLKLPKLKSIPDELFDLPNLESLEIDPASLAGSGEKIARLKKLKKLNGAKPPKVAPKREKPAKKPDEDAPQRLGDVESAGEILVGEGFALAEYAGPKSKLDARIVRVKLGPSSVWAVGDGRIVLVDRVVDGDEATLHDFIDAKPGRSAKKAGTFSIDDSADSWELAIAPANESCVDLAMLLRQSSRKMVRRFGASKGGLLLSVVLTDYDVFVEPGRSVLVPT